MSEQTPSTPVTDDEQWSDETEGSSPQHAGYTPLDQQQYQALGEEDEEEDDGGAAAGNDAGVGGDRSDHDEAGHAQEAWREAAEDGGRGSPQYDVRGREGWEQMSSTCCCRCAGGVFVCTRVSMRRNYRAYLLGTLQPVHRDGIIPTCTTTMFGVEGRCTSRRGPAMTSSYPITTPHPVYRTYTAFLFSRIAAGCVRTIMRLLREG